jgi:cold shock CspA family protein
MDTRETGTVAFFDATRGFGFCIPDGTDAADKSLHCYISAHAVRRAGISSLASGDRITYRREKRTSRKDETQDIVLVEKAAP